MPLTTAALLELRAHEFLKLTTSPLTNLSFSQWGEDMILDHLFFNPKNNSSYSPKGWYVDFGCYHPIQYSNTMMLSLRGWNGLNIDADPDAIRLFNELRPKDINVNYGVGATNEVKSFYRFEVGAVSTLSSAQAKIWQEQHGWKLKETLPVRVRTANCILDEHLPPNCAIDFLNIDLEGLDRSVVTTIDFTRYRPSVIAIELHGLQIKEAANDPTIQHLQKLGYEIVAVCMATYILRKANV